MDGTNFWKADLSGVDFTVTAKKSYYRTIFKEANLSNSNFEGVILSSAEALITTFENKAHLKQEYESGAFSQRSFVAHIFGPGLDNIRVLSTQVSGNDLAVGYVLFNNFTDANLENANFKNAGLWHVDFYSANLTNADLSGADLRKALLNHADLSNANLQGADISGADLSFADLSGADLDGVIYDQYTILKCVGHPICV